MYLHEQMYKLRVRKLNFSYKTYLKPVEYWKYSDNEVPSPITNVTVVSRYIALEHDTFRGPAYRYCIDTSPYRLIPNFDPVTYVLAFKLHPWNLGLIHSLIYVKLNFGISWHRFWPKDLLSCLTNYNFKICTTCTVKNREFHFISVDLDFGIIVTFILLSNSLY